MRNPCRDARIIEKAIEWISLGCAFFLPAILTLPMKDLNILYMIFFFLGIRSILYYLQKRFINFPHFIDQGVSEKDEEWCQKTLKLSSKDYSLYLKTSQKRREFSFVLAASLTLIIGVGFCIYVVFDLQILSLKTFLTFLLKAPELTISFAPLVFSPFYILGFLYGAVKYRHVDKPREKAYHNSCNPGFSAYYTATGDAGTALAMSRH